MVVRTVSVDLVANVSNYVAGMERASAATSKTVAAAVGSEAALRRQAEAFKAVGVVALAGGAVAAAGIALVVKATADYGAKMAQLQSLSHANAATMQQLSDAAMTQGKAFGYSAGQVADAEIELTKAGLSASQILGGGLKASLTLAAAGQLDVGRATEISTIAMTDFGLQAKQLPSVSDALAAGADKALGSVEDLGEGLANGGQQAHNMGLSVYDTIGTLSAFANAGIIGAEGGTQLRSMFIQLQHVTPQAQAVMDKYGISLADASGNFVGVTKFAGELHDRLGSLDQVTRNAALATIFGSHAITGASILYQQGAKGIQSWIDKVHDTGFAAAQASGKLDSLQGDAQKLAAAFQTDLIKAGSGANTELRNLVQTGEHFLDFVGAIPAPVLQIGTALTAVAAGVGLVGGAMIIAVPKIAAFRAEMEEAGISGKSLAATFGKGALIAVGITELSEGLAALGAQGQATEQQLEQTALKAKNGFKGIGSLFKGDGGFEETGGIQEALGDEQGNAGAAKMLDAWTQGLTHFSDVYKTNEGTFQALGEQLAGLNSQNYGAAANGFSQIVHSQHLTYEQTAQLLDQMPAYKDALTKQLGAIGVNASEENLLVAALGRGKIGQELAALAAKQNASAAQQQAAALHGDAAAANSLLQAQNALSKSNQTLESTDDAARDSIDAVKKALQQNGASLDQNTAAGRANREQVLSSVQAIQAHAAAINSDGKHAAEASVYTDQMGVSLVRTMEQFGLSKSAAEAYVGKLLGIPKGVTTEAALRTAQAEQDAEDLEANLQALFSQPIIQSVQIEQNGSVAHGVSAFAAGGAVNGPGPRGRDSVRAVLAPGEHVLTASDVSAMGGQGGVYAWRAALHMATGGEIGDATTSVAAAQRAVTAAQRAYNRASSSGKDAARQKLDDAKQTLQDRQARLATLKQDSEDFVSTQRRATTDNPIDPLSYVDQLRSMSRDDAFRPSQRTKFDQASNKYEAAIVKLSDASGKAAQKLADLQSASDQLKSSITSAVAGGYQASGAASTSTASGWVMRDGLRFQTSSSAVTGASLAAYYSKGATDTGTFAGQLKQLAARGVNAGLLAEIAGYGVAAGGPIAAALLSASASDIATVNAGYQAIQTNAGTAGTVAAGDEYGSQIAAAQKNADQITNQLKTDGEKLRKLIADAFGLKGYAVGTMSASPGLHLVGEAGPELLRFAGGEQVWTAQQTRAYVRGGGQYGRGARVTVPAPTVNYPDTITIKDARGFIAVMEVVADQRIEHDAGTTYTLELGGAA